MATERIAKTSDPSFATLDAEIARFHRAQAPQKAVTVSRHVEAERTSALLHEFGPIGAVVTVSTSDWKDDGQLTSLTLHTAPDNAAGDSYPCIITHQRADQGGRTVLALRFTSGGLQPQVGFDRRRFARWACPEQFHPTGIAANPIQANDYIYFRVSDISTEGLGLLTSPRNRYLAAGQTLDAIVSLPTVRQTSVQLRVRNVRMVAHNDRDHLHVGCSLIGCTETQRASIEQYALQFGPPQDASSAQAVGVRKNGTARPISLSFVNDEDTYREVVNLRRLAYFAEGKTAETDSLAEQSDLHDAKSRILVCRSRGRVIATARLAYPQYGDRTEHEEFFPWPKEFPRRDQTVEVTRACTHPDFRRGGVFFALLRFIVITAMQANRTWVVTSSTSDLVPLYDWIGLRQCGVQYNHPSLNGLPHQVLIGNIPAALVGRSVSAGAWYSVWREALPYLDATQLKNLSTVRLTTYRLIGWLSSTIKSRARF